MSTIKQTLGAMDAAPEVMEITHYRVQLGDVWLHAVRCGAWQEVIKQLRDLDPVWTRPGVELVAARPLVAWFGPFPAQGHTKHWLVEVEE